MAEQNVLEQLLRLKLDRAAAEAAKNDLKILKQGFVDLAATAEKGSNAATTLTKKLGEINRAAQVDKLGKEFGDLSKKIGDTDQAAKLLAGRLADIGASADEINAAGAAFANAQNAASGGGGGIGVEGLRRTGGALTQLGLPGGEAVSRLGDIGQIVKEFQQLVQVIPGVTTVTEALTPALGASAAGFAAMGAVLLPIVGVVLAVAAAAKAFSDELERNKKAFQDSVDAEIKANEQRNQNIELARTRTAEQNRQQAADDEQKFKNQQDLLTQLRQQRAQVDQEFADLGNSFNPQRRAELGDQGKILDKAIEDATNTLIDLGTSIQNTVTILGPEIDQREKEEAAIKAEKDALAAKEKAIADSGKVELEARTLAKTATEDQVRALLDSIKTQRDILAEQAKQTEALGQSSKEYTDQIVILDARTKALTETTLQAAIANDKAKEAAKSAEDAGKAAKKYQDDVKSIDEKFYQDQIDAAQKLADKEVEIQNQAVLAAEQLLENLLQKQADLAKNLGRELSDQQTKAAQDALQKQIDFARAEVAAEKKYQADIARIKRQAEDTEFEQGLDRDFAGLARSKRQTAQQINEVTIQANADRAARLQSYQEQQEDAQRAFANERALKIQHYQEQLKDAQDAYKRDQTQLIVNRNRALVAAQQAEQKELAVLNDKHQKELTAKYQASKVEIDLLLQSSAIRKQILDAEYAHYLAIFQSIQNGSSGGSTQNIPILMASGGNLGAGRFALVNEPGSSGRESFSAGGTTARFPGMGVFMPYKSGQVNANRGGDTFNISPTFNITGGAGSEQKIVDLVDQRLETTVKRIFRTRT